MAAFDADITFRDLLAPVTPEEFFAEYSGKRHLYVPGGVEKIDGLFGWDEFNQVVNMTTVWNAQTMKMALDGRNLAPEEFCTRGRAREGTPMPVPDWSKVGRLLGEGATIVLDLMEMLHPGSAAMATAIQMATASQVMCNAYCSRRQKPAFRSHFDTMEVFAVHIEGQKIWRLYEGRYENPIEADGHRFASFSPEYHERAKGALLEEITMTPGDVLYIPRGQYHDALASSDACLHLSFGTTRPTGVDFVRSIIQALVDDPLFRREMPNIDEPEAYQEHVQLLAERLRQVVRQPQVARDLLDEQQRRLFRQVPGLNLPKPAFPRFYRVKPCGVKLTRRGPDWTLNADGNKTILDEETARIAEWVLPRDIFTMDDLQDEFPMMADDTVRNAVGRLRSAGVVFTAETG